MGSGHVFTIDRVTVSPGGASLCSAFELEGGVPIAVSTTRSRFDFDGHAPA
jgi:hypothetical protein